MYKNSENQNLNKFISKGKTGVSRLVESLCIYLGIVLNLHRYL